jgi:hypothetical protein
MNSNLASKARLATTTAARVLILIPVLPPYDPLHLLRVSISALSSPNRALWWPKSGLFPPKSVRVPFPGLPWHSVLRPRRIFQPGLSTLTLSLPRLSRRQFNSRSTFTRMKISAAISDCLPTSMMTRTAYLWRRPSPVLCLVNARKLNLGNLYLLRAKVLGPFDDGHLPGSLPRTIKAKMM